MFAGQSNFLQAIGWAVLNSLWQMAIIWVLYSMLTGAFKQKPSQKANLATGLLIAGFAWFAYTFISILTIADPQNTIISTGIVSESANLELNNWLRKMLPLASILYLLLLILPVFNFMRNYSYVQTIRKNELSKISVDWRIFVKNVSAMMGIRKPVHIWLSGLVTSPVTIGFLKPVILVPVAAINHLTSEQLEAVILHELAHIRRHDYLINLVIRFIQSVLYFNPFVKALVKSIEREREKSCDDIVLQFQYDPHGYASALLTIEKSNHLPKPFAVAASGKKNDLLHRVEWLLGIKKKEVISFNKLAGVFAGLICFIGLNALLIAGKPEKAESSTASLPHMRSPFYFFTSDMLDKRIHHADPIENNSTPIITEAMPIEEEPASAVAVEVPVPPASPEMKELEMEALAPKNLNPAFQYVNFIETVLPKLEKEQELQVKEAMASSKKVLKEIQWKAVENELAEVLSSQEKEWVKKQYEKEIAKVDWKQLEENVKIAYDRIDWKTINEQLNVAMAEIKLDSLKSVYNMALVQLSNLEKQLEETPLKGIPDTDITVEAVDQRKQEVREAIKTIKAVMDRKIIQL